MKKLIITGVFLTMFFAMVTAQTSTMDSNSVKAMLELTNIQLASAAYDNQQFDISIITSDGTISDTLVGNCKIQGDQYRSVFDSVEQVQNSFINLEIHHDGKVMVASKPVSFTKQFFKGNVDEALFQGMNVESLATITAGADKQLVFDFLPESEYAEYKITYDPGNYRVSEVYIKMKVADGAGSFMAGDFITSRILLQHFTSISAPVTFDTTPYLLIGAAGQLQTQPAYSDYEIVNLQEEN